MSATAHRRTNCGCHRAEQDYAKNTHAQSNVFCGDNAERLLRRETSECYVKEFERAGWDDSFK